MPVSDANWTVITGSTGGIGREIVKILANQGNNMILINRSETQAKAQYSELSGSYPDLKIELITADFMDITQIIGAVKRIHKLPGKVDALYNNSGILTGDKVLSAQGFESQFAVNTLAPYLLIKNLQDKMTRPSTQTPAVIVNFSSSAISSLKKLDLDNLPNPEKVGGLLSTYAQTKLALTALAPALADGLKSKNIIIRSVDPGATKSAMTTGGNSGMPKFLSWLAPIFFASPDKQAAKIIESAKPQSFNGRTGIYVANLKEKKMPAPANDPLIQDKLIVLLNGLIGSHTD